MIASLILVLQAVSTSSSEASSPGAVQLMVIEWQGDGVRFSSIPEEDDSGTNEHYELLPYWWQGTALYYINPKNDYGFTEDDVIATIKMAADNWDEKTSSEVFAYQGTTTKRAGGRRDGYNVVAWGRYYNPWVIAVTYIWYTGDKIVESDTRMNTRFKWSLTGEAKKMDVQNIMTHEFGHWCGLDDLYADEDYWLTMYGYADYGETYKQTLGLGDILGLQARYGE